MSIAGKLGSTNIDNSPRKRSTTGRRKMMTIRRHLPCQRELKQFFILSLMTNVLESASFFFTAEFLFRVGL
jgi:hypothetical protein